MFHPAEQNFLGREFADTFNKILVAVPVLGHDLAEAGYHGKRIGIVKPAQARVFDLGEFKAVKPPAGFKHPDGFGQGCIYMCHVPQAEGDGVNIHAFIRDGQGFRVARDPAKVREPPVKGAVATHGEHLSINIAQGDAGAGPGFLPDAEGDIPGAARNIQIIKTGPRADAADQMVLPQAVNPGGHEIIHDVIGRGNGIKHLPDQPGLILGLNAGVTKPVFFGVVSHAVFINTGGEACTGFLIDIIF